MKTISKLFAAIFALAVSGGVAIAATPIPFFDGEGGVSCENYNSAFLIPWKNKGGDYLDASGALNGKNPFSTAVSQYGATGLSADLTSVTKAAIAKKDATLGIVAKYEPNGGMTGPLVIGSRTNTGGLAPVLEYSFTDGTKEKAYATASVSFDCSSALPFKVSSLMSIGNGLAVFDFPLPSKPTKLSKAALTVGIAKTWGGGMKSGFYLLSRAEMPGDTTPVTYGLAKSYAGDYGIKSNPNVLSAMNFSPSDVEGNAFAKQLPSDTSSITQKDDASKFSPLYGNALKVTVKKGNVWAISNEYKLKALNGGVEPEEAYFRYYLRYGNNWGSRISGGKLPGLAGTYGNGGWGGRTSDGYNGWSARGFFSGWPDVANPLNGYNYLGSYFYYAKQEGIFWDIWKWGGPLVKDNEWHSVEQHVKLNTPGKPDGIFQAWVDGKLAYERKDLLIRNTSALKIESAWFDVYHGGLDAPDHDMDLYIDNVVIAKSYVWPAVGTPPAPIYLPPVTTGTGGSTSTGSTSTGSNSSGSGGSSGGGSSSTGGSSGSSGIEALPSGTVLNAQSAFAGSWNDGESGITRDCLSLSKSVCWKKYLGDWSDSKASAYGTSPFGWFEFGQRSFDPATAKADVTDWLKAEISKSQTEFNVLLLQRTKTGGSGPTTFYSREDASESKKPFLIVTTSSGSTYLVRPFADAQIDPSTYKGLGGMGSMQVGGQTRAALGFPIPAEVKNSTVSKAYVRLVSANRYSKDGFEMYRLAIPGNSSSVSIPDSSVTSGGTDGASGGTATTPATGSNPSSGSTSTGSTSTGGTSSPSVPGTPKTVAGSWTEVLGTQMSKAVPDYAYSLPVSAAGGPKNVMDAWGGGAYDTKRDALLVFGGGHGDYAGNEVYSYSLTGSVWIRLSDPTKTPTYVDPTNMVVSLLLTNSWGYYADGTPVSRHTYDLLEYLPSVDSLCSFGASGAYPNAWTFRNVDCFQISTKKWVRKAPVPAYVAYGHSVYDSLTGHAFVISQGPASQYYEYAPETDSWIIHTITGNADFFTWLPLGFVAELDETTRTVVLTNGTQIATFPLPPKGTKWSYASPSKIMNLSKTVGTSYPGTAYDPVLKKVVVWSGGKSVYALDPTTGNVSETVGGGSDPGSPALNGTYGRFRYSPALDAYVVTNSISKNVFVFKPAR